MSEWRLRPFGERALLIEIARRPSVAAARRVAQLSCALDGLPGVAAVIPGATSVLVELDSIDEQTIAAAARAALAAPLAAAASREHHIPVAFGGADGPDLDEVAQFAGLSPEGVINALVRARLTVAFLGFAPGFPYLIGLPRRLAVPRLATPRVRVPAGAVALADGWAGIYPRATPGGWRLVGRTAVTLFDPAAVPPARLMPGDRVRFIAT
ncbi:MAG: 5-oxoprolinase subunit PxpB [Chloroflexota bacterium]|nr:5-oxoprolinase subunit PxpB [Dehalococcoidia bacterium]MDW8252288.1 5-oxoprolinase subunit PxpB [Chloroflexota bacterium]